MARYTLPWRRFAARGPIRRTAAGPALRTRAETDAPVLRRKADLTAQVEPLAGAAGGIALGGGPGVGVVTKPGLGLEVGGSAISVGASASRKLRKVSATRSHSFSAPWTGKQRRNTRRPVPDFSFSPL